MALNVQIPSEESSTFYEAKPPISACNDAFSFWKLPDAWRSELEHLTKNSEAVARHYLLEEYLPAAKRRPPSQLQAYYRIKNLIPLWLRHHINSIAIRGRHQSSFPHWPCESALIDFWREFLHRSLDIMQVTDSWHIGFWPHGKRCCIVLTHDVESPLGMSRMEAMADLEEKHGFRSCWNLPLAQYEIDWSLVDRLRQRGFEFGAHGLSHDGQLFRSQKDFARLAPKIEEQAREHGMRGFRAPSTLRCIDWIGSMDFDYDSTLSDTDPYEPQPGGTCSIFPFFLSDMVELPYTVPQDHTLINVLRRDPRPVWFAKARWLAAVGGMILTLTHPDYTGVPPYLGWYEELLKLFGSFDSAWCALPQDVAAWWKHRHSLQLLLDHNRPVVPHAGHWGATAVRLSSQVIAK